MRLVSCLSSPPSHETSGFSTLPPRMPVIPVIRLFIHPTATVSTVYGVHDDRKHTNKQVCVSAVGIEQLFICLVPMSIFFCSHPSVPRCRWYQGCRGLLTYSVRILRFRRSLLCVLEPDSPIVKRVARVRACLQDRWGAVLYHPKG